MLIGRAGAAIKRAGAEIERAGAKIMVAQELAECAGVVIEFVRELGHVGEAEAHGDAKAIVHASMSAEHVWEFLRFGGALILFDRERSRVHEESIRVGELRARGGGERIQGESAETRGRGEES